ncbi:hypothetical protein HPB52_003544 [Rhipicephalus sanguineus]|uniref:Uncharacterized protein n=1 Tax=Rhipicephalus sanguineus TaxID=34632 RepID=A0A9D4QHR2_RHISA|nr:hypothetical protein HPB52_003544 [Rhipicephalus sanguineus]
MFLDAAPSRLLEGGSRRRRLASGAAGHAPAKVEIIRTREIRPSSFLDRGVCEEVARALEGKVLTHHVVIWFPPHKGAEVGALANANELAHVRARGLAGRLVHWEASVLGGSGDGLSPTFSGKSHEGSCRDSQAHANELVSHTVLSRYTEVTPLRADCGGIRDVKHMLWEYPSLQHHMDHGLADHDWFDYLWAAQKAHDAEVRLGLPDPM